MDDLWKGKLPLGMAFWGFYLIPVLLARVALGSASEVLHDVMLALISAIISCYAIFSGIGAYRSSQAYRNSIPIKYLAQFFIVFGLFSNGMVLLLNVTMFFTISKTI